VNGRRGSPDFVIMAVSLILLTIGLIMVFSASAVTAYLDYGDSFYFLKRQLFSAGVAVAVMILAMNFDFMYLKRLANLLLIGSLFLLMLVLIIGTVSHGSSRWLDLGFRSVQPSEIVKLSMVVFMAKSLSENRSKMEYLWVGMMPNLAVLGVVCGLILLQPDLGTAVCIAGTVYCMFIAAGSKFRHLALLAGAGIGLVVLAIVLSPYRMERFTAFWNPWADPSDTGYQTIQSLLALGSGGLVGMGLGQSRQKFFYLPERHTDFIYAILGEELGFIGAALVLLLFFVLLWRGFKVALTIQDSFGSLLAVGVTCMIIVQMVINVGVVTGTLPVTGITLPFVSYGGSSLVFVMLGVGILLNISRYTSSK
jgi:cell division protein FtsW